METLDWKPTRKSIKQKHFILYFHQINNYRLLKNYTIPNNGYKLLFLNANNINRNYFAYI